MNYMHLLVGHPTQKSKKLEVCYVLGDTAYVRPKRLKEDAKVTFIDWPDTVLGRLQAAYDRIPLKDDRDSVLVDYRKLVGCLKDAFITLTDGSYESSEFFEETCFDSDLRRVFLSALGVFGKDIPTVLRSKTNDIWDFLEELGVSEIPDKAVFNRLQERYVDKGFSVFALPEALIGHHYGTIIGGPKIYQDLLFDLIRPFDALFLVNTSLTTLAKIKQGVFKSETIDGQLLNVIGDWLHYLDAVVDQTVTLNEWSKETRVASYKAMFEEFQAYGGLNGVSLHLFSDMSLSSVLLEELKEELLKSNVRDADSVLSESDSVSFEQTTSLLDKSLVSLTTATSELENDVIGVSEVFSSDVAALDEAITSTSEKHQSNSLYYSEALSEVAVEDFVNPVTDGEPMITYVKQSVSDLKDSEVSGVYIADDIKSPVFTWPADNAEFRALPSREQLEKYAVEKDVSLFDLRVKENTVKLPGLDVPKKDTFYVESSDGSVLNREILKKDTFYVEPLPNVQSEEDNPVSGIDIPEKDTFYIEPVSQKAAIDYWQSGQSLFVTDNKSSLQEARLEVLLDRLPPKDVLKNVYVDYGPLRSAVQLCLLQDFYDVRVMVDDLLTLFDAIGRGDYALYDDLRREKITSLRSGLIRCLLEIKGTVVSPFWDNQTDDLLGFDVKTVQQVLTNLVKIYGRNEGTIERWFTVSNETKRLIKQALSYVSDDTMFVKVPVSLRHTEFSDWLTEKECDALSQLLFFDAKKTDWYRSKAIEKDLMERYKDCSLLPLDFLKDDTVTNPSRYRKNNIEAWDFTIQSLLPHPLATVAEYVIRYHYKGGREDLEKALAWAKKAESSLAYLQKTVGYGDDVVNDLPVVDADMFPDCSEGQRDVLRAVQKATLALRGSLGYGEPEEVLRDVTNGVKALLEEL